MYDFNKAAHTSFVKEMTIESKLKCIFQIKYMLSKPKITYVIGGRFYRVGKSFIIVDNFIDYAEVPTYSIGSNKDYIKC